MSRVGYWTLIWCFIFLSVGVFLPSLYAGQQLENAGKLEALLKEALSNNPQFHAAQGELQAARYRIPQAFALPDPTVGYAVMGPMLETPLGPQKDIYEFEQMIPFPAKLIEKRKMAAAEVKAAEARLKMVERDIVLKVSEAYYDFFRVDATTRIVEEIRDSWRKSEAIAQSRYASQGGSQGDVARVQAEVSGAAQRLLILQQERQTLMAWMDSLLNRRETLALIDLPEPPLPSLTLTLQELLQVARENRPELLEASAQEEREGHAQTLAKYEYAPDLTVGFQYFRIGEGATSDPDDGRDAWMIPLKITIPLWQNRIGPGVLEAKQNFKSTQSRHEQVRNLTEYELKNAYYRFMAQKDVLELYRNALIPQAELAFHSQEAAYETGRGDVLNLIDSEQVYLNVKLSYYQSFAEVLKSFAALERAVGKNLTQQGGRL